MAQNRGNRSFQLVTPTEPRVVVTGMGMVTPLAAGAMRTFERARAGESGISEIRSFDTNGLPCRIGGEVDDDWLEASRGDPRPGLTGRDLRLLLAASREAADQAGLDEIDNRGRVATAIGAHGENPSLDQLRVIHGHTDGMGGWDREGLVRAGGFDHQHFLRRKPDVTAALVATHHRCLGPCLAIGSACAAGCQAIGEAAHLIRDGRADAVLAGGCESNLNFVGFIGFVLLRALAERSSSPETASRPFDRKRCGFVLSEGAGALVLESREHALSRGVEILGEILGYGDSADAYRVTDPHPDGRGAVTAMARALAYAGREPGDVDYINAHGTSTVSGDIAETRAIKELLGPRADQVPVSSNKSMLGHTIAAAGAIECILTLIGLSQSTILPTINYDVPDPRCNLDYVPNAARSLDCRVALSNSFGFGGQNGCLCLGRCDG